MEHVVSCACTGAENGIMEDHSSVRQAKLRLLNKILQVWHADTLNYTISGYGPHPAVQLAHSLHWRCSSVLYISHRRPRCDQLIGPLLKEVSLTYSHPQRT